MVKNGLNLHTLGFRAPSQEERHEIGLWLDLLREEEHPQAREPHLGEIPHVVTYLVSGEDILIFDEYLDDTVSGTLEQAGFALLVE